MRLLNVKTLGFEEFIGEFGDGIPLYAILSHTWGVDEVSYRDYIDKKDLEKQGFDKIHGCCRIAALEGFQYIWIDTCCIDKSSSAELSEAINSMFQWYRDAGICYAYLDDVDSSEDPTSNGSSFTRSRWFTRGWTLQELLAPTEVVFLGSNWMEIGTKRTLRASVSYVTRISEKVLDECRWAEYSVAQKMSWAAGRRTTRLEDEAYCLMGLFDVNMPLLYGEGRKAFSRLQQEILKQSDDQSIFAWSHPEQDYSHTQVSGLMAPSPEYFKDSSQIELLQHQHGMDYENAFQIVNRQIRVRLRLVDNIKAIKLRQSLQLPNLYLVIEIQHSGERNKGDRSTPVVQSTPPSHPSPPQETICGDSTSLSELTQHFTLPTITIESEDADIQDFELGLDVPSRFLKQSFENPLVPRLHEGEELLNDLDIPLLDSSDQNITSDVNAVVGPESWRWYIYEPAIIVPLRCHINGLRLGILLSRSATETEGKALLRLHNPSIVSISLQDLQRTPIQTVHVPISVSNSKWPVLPGYGVYSLVWPEIRIASLLSAGYLVHPDCGLGWELDLARAALVQKATFKYETDMIDYAPFVLFYRISTTVTSSTFFFMSIPVSKKSDLICEIGVYANGVNSHTALNYSLYSFDLAKDRRAEVSLGNGEAVVVKYREGRGIRFVNVSIGTLSGDIAAWPVPRESAKTDFLSSRLFPKLRSLRKA